MIDQAKRDELESLVNNYGMVHVTETLADIARERAAGFRHTRRTKSLARLWEAAATKLDEAARFAPQ